MLVLSLCSLFCAAGAHGSAAYAAKRQSYVADEILVRYAPSARATVASASKAAISSGTAGTIRLRLPRGVTMAVELSRLRREHGVRWAVPDFLAHATGGLIPNDRGLADHGGRLAAAAVELHRPLRRRTRPRPGRTSPPTTRPAGKA